MCGIAGVLALGDRSPDPEWGPLLAGALAHRGPDGHGVWADGRIVLAHTRLAIIDLGVGGAQPMRSPDGRFALVQNGEIYNYRERRAALADRGVEWRTQSDTEVLLQSLAADGVRALEALRGMWAFALWDRERETLLLARDRLGKKPIVWVRTPEWFAFASEASALLRLPFVRARLDRETLPLWLGLAYAPAPRTLLDGVRKLPAASWLAVSRAEPDADPVRWWHPPRPDPEARADDAWWRAFDEELVEAARLRTVSDVPIGVFLSGGVDSNVVLEALHRTGHHPLRTYTLGFEGLDDERPRARAAARRFSDDHVELVVRPDVAGEVDAVLDRFADPLGDSAVVTSALLAREAAKHVKVIVNGDGGDELFGGYPRYPFARRADLARRLPVAFGVLRRRYAGRANAGPALALLEAAGPGAAARALSTFVLERDLDALLAPGFPRARAEVSPPIVGHDGPGLVDALFAWDTGIYLPDDLLVKVDVASMACALENRSPLLDHRLFERVALLPPARRVDARRTKPLLKTYARGRVPDEVLDARKQGFQLPLERWLLGPLRGWAEGLLRAPEATAPLWKPGAPARVLDAFLAGRSDDLGAYRVWTLAVLERWARTFGVEVE